MNKIVFYIFTLTYTSIFGFDYPPPCNKWKEISMTEHSKNIHRVSETSLLHNCKWEYSQYGEDGIIEEIFRRLNIKNGFFVEFGAMDGVTISNTYNLFKKGWKGIYIEGSSEYEPALNKNFPKGCGVKFCIEFIKWKDSQGGKYIDDILDEFIGNQSIDFLSIDIDGGDYYILKKLKRRPKVICVECGEGFHPLFDKAIDEIKTQGNINQPMGLFIRQGIEMGYTPVCFNVINLFLVKNEYAHLFSEIQNDPITLFRDSFRVKIKKERFVNNRKEIYPHLEDQLYDLLLPITIDF